MQVGGEGNPVGRIRPQAASDVYGTNKGDGGIYFKSLRPLLLLMHTAGAMSEGAALFRPTIGYCLQERKRKKMGAEKFRIYCALYWVQWRFNFAGVGVVVFVIKFAAWSHRTFFPGVFSCISVVCLGTAAGFLAGAVGSFKLRIVRSSP